ncbi:oleate hydratase [Agromyces archimandritae]|uniref:Oleate hydratase n=1 Tax=Agromyces archimandritae TaxID=2781962 RepID=A0A975FPF0_9MICO|nr:oleate hydratase [Agromyces archimandritae]QTX05950.1 oleate hydratase [Agromyces archimandritae]
MYTSGGEILPAGKPGASAWADEASAWIVGAGLSSMAAAGSLIRDGRMPGPRITVLERRQLPAAVLGETGGSGAPGGSRGFPERMPAVRELLAAIPSLEIDGASVLDELDGAPAHPADALALPLYKWLLDAGVAFRFATEVTGIHAAASGPRIAWTRAGTPGGVALAPGDLVLSGAPLPRSGTHTTIAGASDPGHAVRSGVDAARALLARAAVPAGAADPLRSPAQAAAPAPVA